MTGPLAIRGWISLALLLLAAGCASWRSDPYDYGLAGDAEPAGRGFLTSPTSKLVKSAKSVLGWGPDEAAARVDYEVALNLYQSAAATEGDQRTDRFLEAADQFASAADRWPSSSIEEDALFHRAESYFFADRYPKAEELFGQLLGKYPNSKYLEKVSRRRFQLAKYWLDHHDRAPDLPVTPNLTSRDRPLFDKFGHAIRVLENIRLDDPTGELADDATMLAASACFKDGRYYRADELLNDLRRSFPGSQHQFEAHLLGLQCKIQLYQGPNYDSGPLEDAEELVKQMRRQFPREAREHDEYLAKAWKDVRMNRAIREMNLARYRDRRQEYRAARIQYGRVAREFGDTSLSEEAEERLARLGDRPDLPPQRLKWLASVFPSTSDEEPLIATRSTDTTR